MKCVNQPLRLIMKVSRSSEHSLLLSTVLDYLSSHYLFTMSARSICDSIALMDLPYVRSLSMTKMNAMTDAILCILMPMWGCATN